MKFWMVKLYLDVSDVIQANEHAKYAHCGLPVNFWIFFDYVILFYDKKDHFKQKCYFGLRSP